MSFRKKTQALEALKEIRQKIKRFGITEKELQEAGLKMRKEISKKH